MPTKQTTNQDENLICGLKPEYIRKKFFSREISALLTEIQSSQELGEKDLQGLIAFMTTLQNEDKSVIDKVMAAFPGSKIIDDSEIKPPSVDELMNGVSDDEWREKADKAIEFIGKTLDNLRLDISDKKKIPDSYWLDTAIIFISYQDILERDRIYKTQQYFAKLTNIIDDCGCSRLEAENRSKLTKEYSDYKYITLLLERMDKFDQLMKKKDNDSKYNN